MMGLRSSALAAAAMLLLLSCSSSSAFAPLTPTVRRVLRSTATTTTTTTTTLFGNTKVAPSLPELKNISYGEESRKYRRTVYSHDDWIKHRNPDRFFYYISGIFSSGIYKNLGREVMATTGIATFICVFNAIVGGYTDFGGVKHAALISSSLLPLMGLPLAPFTLSTPALGLLLGRFLFSFRCRSVGFVLFGSKQQSSHLNVPFSFR